MELVVETSGTSDSPKSSNFVVVVLNIVGKVSPEKDITKAIASVQNVVVTSLVRLEHDPVHNDPDNSNSVSITTQH